MSVHTNSLIHEASPYLLQHAHNPVDWFPWGDDALAMAKKLGKPMFISIGYSACHWCHVMEHESFGDEVIAERLNKEFVCVKVDREERPDIDAIFMQSIQMLNGYGGWPLNCFALPDGRPFWGGTYFKPNDFKELLTNVANLFRERKSELEEQAENLIQRLHDSIIDSGIQTRGSISREDIDSSLKGLSFYFDIKDGGFKGAPKFPMPVIWQLLIKQVESNRNKELQLHLNHTLTRMAFGGIYDQIGGGFARYSTDSKWRVPHFEKMLYDNAQLISLYSEAYKTDKAPLYLDVIDETLEFVDREMTAPEGGYYSALDADSDGHEGHYYIWDQDEWNKCLGEYARLLGRYFNIGGDGEWVDGANILHRSQTDADFAQQNFLSVAELKALVSTSKKALLKMREKRNPPATDTKIIASWNAMMVKAFVDAYSATGNYSYLEKAVEGANFILQNLMNEEGKMFHIFPVGEKHISGFLEDYAFLAEAMLSIYQATFDEKWLLKSLHISEFALSHFGGEHPVMLHMAEQNYNQFPVNPVEITDGVIPSANAVLALTIYRLSRYFYRPDLSDRTLAMLANVITKALKSPSSFAHWLSIALEINVKRLLVAICGDKAFEFHNEMAKYYLPFALFSVSRGQSKLPCLMDRFKEGHTLIYICTSDYCLETLENPEEAIRLIKEYFSS